MNLTTPTHVTVQLDVPAVTYDSETNVVRYGTDRSSLDQVSVAVHGRTSVELVGRQVAKNSNGSESSKPSLFRITKTCML